MRRPRTRQTEAGRAAFLRAVLTVASGSIIGSAVGFFVSPFLTRLFTPSEFGAFSVITAIVLTLGSAVCGRFELAALIPKSSSEAKGLLTLGAGVATSLVLLLTLIALLGEDLLHAQTPDNMHGLFIAVPLLLVPVASYQLLNSWAVRQSRYRAMATRNVLQATGTAVAQLAAGLLSFGVWGLLAGFFAGQAVGAMSLLYRAGLRPRASGEPVGLRHLASSYRKFPLVLAPAGFVNTLGAHAPLLVIASTYGAVNTGLMALALRVLSVPATLLGQSTAQVFVSELARSKREGASDQLLPLFMRTTKILAMIGAAVAVIVAPASYLLFGSVFGDEWSQAGLVAALLCPGVAVQLVSSPLSQTLTVFERLGMVALWDAVRLVTSTGVLLVAFASGASFATAVGMLSAVNASVYAWYWSLSYRTIVRASSDDPTG